MSRRGARTVGYAGVAAAPDTATIGRVLGLQAFIGGGLNGQRTDIVGVDRGDPTTSLTGPVSASPSPTAAQAAVTAGNDGYKPTPTIQDRALTDPSLDPYNALLLARMGRP